MGAHSSLVANERQASRGQGSDCRHVEQEWLGVGGRLSSESADQTYSWEMVGGGGGAMKVLRREHTEGAGSRVGQGLQNLARRGHVAAPGTHPDPLWSTQGSHSLTTEREPTLRTAREAKLLEMAQNFF